MDDRPARSVGRRRSDDSPGPPLSALPEVRLGLEAGAPLGCRARLDRTTNSRAAQPHAGCLGASAPRASAKLARATGASTPSPQEFSSGTSSSLSSPSKVVEQAIYPRVD